MYGVVQMSRAKSTILIASLGTLLIVVPVIGLAYSSVWPGLGHQTALEDDNARAKGEYGANSASPSGQTNGDGNSDSTPSGTTADNGKTDKLDDKPKRARQPSRAKPWRHPWRERAKLRNDLPVLKATTVAGPSISGQGRDGSFRSFHQVPPTDQRRTGLVPNRPAGWDEPKRLVRGRVYELTETGRVPLSGAMVSDWQDRHRTFTDAEGRFEFHAFWTSEDDTSTTDLADPASGSEYSVVLSCAATGYAMMGPWLYDPSLRSGIPDERYYQRELETADGAELYMRRQENETIEVRLQNAELATGEVTVCLGSIPRAGSLFDDEAMCVSATMDADGRAFFSVPPGAFGLLGVSGGKVSTTFPKCSLTHVSENHKILHVPLEPCDNYFVQGAVTDLRTGKPVPFALVRGSNRGEFTFADEHGRFAFWIGHNVLDDTGQPDFKNTQTLSFEAHGYLGFGREANPEEPHDGYDGTATVAPGGNAEGPWAVGLRPWAAATGRIELTGYTWDERNRIGPDLRSADIPPGTSQWVKIGADGTFAFDRIPWGVTSLRASAQVGDRRTVQDLRVDQRCWLGDGPYQLVAEVSD